MELRYFKLSDFDCSATGENEMDPEFLKQLDELRHRCGFPFYVTSGYRSAEHPVEKKKLTPGTHNQGIASDISITDGVKRHIIVKEAMAMGFTGIGIAKTFVHVDIRTTTPVVWTY